MTLCVTHVRFYTHILTIIFNFIKLNDSLNKLLISAWEPHLKNFIYQDLVGKVLTVRREM